MPESFILVVSHLGSIAVKLYGSSRHLLAETSLLDDVAHWFFSLYRRIELRLTALRSSPSHLTLQIDIRIGRFFSNQGLPFTFNAWSIAAHG